MEPPNDHSADLGAPERDELTAFMETARRCGRVPEALRLWADFSRLQERTAWPDDVLRGQLHCDLRAFAKLEPDDVERSLLLSRRYLGWLRDLLAKLGDQPSPLMARHVVFAARTMFDDAGGPADVDRLDRCERAVESASADGLTATHYLALGQVDRAFDVAALGLDGTVAGERARRLADARSALAGALPHVHPAHRDLIDTPQGVEELGAGVHNAIREHLRRGCATCGTTAQPDHGAHSQAA